MPPDPKWLDRAWPVETEPAAAATLRDRVADVAPGLLDAPGVAALLGALASFSPHLAELVVREHAALADTAQHGPDAAAAAAMRALAAVLPDASRAQVAAALRTAKRRIALITAVADIGGLWTLAQVTAALSNLAEAALQLAVTHLLRAAHDQGALRLPDPARPAQGSGFIVLAMGKLGARELNYSSDIDLVLLYDPAAHPYHETGLGAVFTRFARDLVALFETRDEGGYVFRTDLRLRPDPAATPPVLALPAATAYYESMGQNWERAAMIKARPIAGDLLRGARFLADIRPFVWRRHLDFAAIADIHAMKRRIDEHKGSALNDQGDAAARVLGHDVKLGQGGIREIEFIAQTLQLVWGGRAPALRQPATLAALRALVRAGRLSPRAMAELSASYRFLRCVEHRLQMVADRQTHRLPADAAGLERFARFMGKPGAHEFAVHLLRRMESVRRHYADLFAQPDRTSGLAPLDFSGVDEAPADTVADLRELGFQDPGRVVAAVRGWQAGRVRALRSARSREIMGAVLPPLLAAFGRQSEPDAAFVRLDRLLSALPAGVQLLSMFQRNPALMERVAAVLGAAPSLAEHLALVPSALEGLLTPDGPADDPAQRLQAQLADARGLEETVIIARRAVRAEEFRLCVAQMEGWLDVDRAGLIRTALAEATMATLLPLVMAEHASRYGLVPGGGMAVVALGKAGGREMMAGSDLDLMLVYDHPEDVTESQGARAVPASQYFIRASHAYVAALTAPGLEGPLYAVDMRLRPSGNKGPVAVSLAAFRHYHAHDAWTWERMALTRARVVAGPEALGARIMGAIADATALHPGPATIRADAASMRGRLLRDLPGAGPWDVKLRPGGQMEVEFIAQALELSERVFDPTTRTALHRLAAADALAEPDATLLIHADHTWRTVQSLLRILVGRTTEPPPPSALTALATALGVEPSAVPGTLDTLAAQVRAAFIRLIGDPA